MFGALGVNGAKMRWRRYQRAFAMIWRFYDEIGQAEDEEDKVDKADKVEHSNVKVNELGNTDTQKFTRSWCGVEVFM